MSGEFNEKIIGDKLTISIGGSIYKLKLTSRLTLTRPVERKAHTAGHDYGFGAGDHSFSGELDASTPDLATIGAWNVRDSNGDLPVQACVISFPPTGGGATVTASFNAKFPHLEIDNPGPDARVKVRFNGKITSEDVTWG